MGMTEATAECMVGGETLTMHPLSLREIEEIDNWMRVKFLRSIKEAAEGDQTMIATGMEEMMKLSFFTRMGTKFLSSLDGVAYVMAKCTGITHSEAMDLIRVNYKLASFNDTFKMLNSTGEKGSDFPKKTKK